MCKHDPDLYRTSRPRNPIYSTVNGIRLIGSEYRREPEMITQLRMPWFSEVGNHPLSPLYAKSYMNDDNCLIYCPYCNHSHEPDGYDCDEYSCESCDRDFLVSAEFGSGFSTEPMPCKNDAHHSVFSSQYFYKGEAVRIFNCVYCGAQGYEKSQHTLMPWLPEYDNPDTFDPDGILKTGADLSVRSKTPVLDYIKKKSELFWVKPDEAKRALSEHNKIYGSEL